MIQKADKPVPREAVIYIRSIPRDVKDQFKAWCAKRGYTMTEMVEHFMRRSVNNTLPKYPKRKKKADAV